jgi:hypothetical protein
MSEQAVDSSVYRQYSPNLAPSNAWVVEAVLTQQQCWLWMQYLLVFSTPQRQHHPKSRYYPDAVWKDQDLWRIARGMAAAAWSRREARLM